MAVEVKALACALPKELGLPLSRLSCADIRRYAVERGIVAQVSDTTVWRWLSEDALRPWTHRSWIFPRDPAFTEKAGRVLDLYHGLWEGLPLGPGDFVLSADEKSQIQIRQRLHAPSPAAPGTAARVENEYKRLGPCAYLAAWDVHQARLFGAVVDRTTNAAFDAFVDMVMEQEPYRSAQRVFWVVDNGTIHRGERARARLTARWPKLVLVHLPVHASWLNQIEIYFSILQRKGLTPDDFATRAEAELRILRFQQHYQKIARPFEWKFTREDLHHMLSRSRPLEQAA